MRDTNIISALTADAETFRQKIIDVGIRGRLTKQRPEDGNARELFAQIQAEKEKLIKQGKIKKQKPLPPIKPEEIPFEIPENWMWVRINDVFAVLNGDRGKNYPAKSSLTHNGIPFISAINLNGETVVRDERLLCLSENQFQNLRAGKLSKGDIVVCIRGSLGKHGIYPFEKGAIASSLVICRNYYKINELSTLFMFYLDTEIFFDQVFKYNNGTAQPNLAAVSLEKFLFPLPPLAEQKRIVEKIKEILKAQQNLQSALNAYTYDISILKSKIIDAGIQGKLTEQLPEDGTAQELFAKIQQEKENLIKEGKIRKQRPLPSIKPEEIPFEVPKNWTWVKLGDVVTVLGGKRIPAGRSLTTENTGHKYIRVSEMKNRSVITDNLLYVPNDIYPSIQQYIINKEDVYITVAGTIGRVGKIPEELDGANLTENADRLVFTLMNQDWMIYCLSSSIVQKQIERLTTQVAQPKLAIKRIQDFLIPLPPLGEQQRIAGQIEQILNAIDE